MKMTRIVMLLVMILLVSGMVFMAAELSPYKKARDEAKALEASGDYKAAHAWYLKAAEVAPTGWVKSWQLNNAAMMIIKESSMDENNNITKKAAQEALKILKEALKMSEDSNPNNWTTATETIKKNILYCERVLGLKPWPKG